MYSSSAEVIEHDEAVSEARARKEIEDHGLMGEDLEACLTAAYLGPDRYSSARIMIELGY